MASQKGTRWVVHLTLEDFSKRRARSVEEAIGQSCLIKDILEKHQPGWERPSADEAVLVTSALAREDVDTLLSWTESLREAIQKTAEMNASVGVAATRLAARTASRLARPSGLLLLLPGYESGFLASVSLEELDELRSGQAAALRKRGIRTLGDLSELKPGEARSVLGPDAVKLMSLVRGADGRVDRIGDGRMERAVSALCRRAAKRLYDERVGARGLELCLLYRDGVSLERYTIVPRPARVFGDLERSALSLLRWFPTRREPVVGLSLTATGLCHLPDRLPFYARPRDVRVSLGRI